MSALPRRITLEDGREAMLGRVERRDLDGVLSALNSAAEEEEARLYLGPTRKRAREEDAEEFRGS